MKPFLVLLLLVIGICADEFNYELVSIKTINYEIQIFNTDDCFIYDKASNTSLNYLVKNYKISPKKLPTSFILYNPELDVSDTVHIVDEKISIDRLCIHDTIISKHHIKVGNPGRHSRHRGCSL